MNRTRTGGFASTQAIVIIAIVVIVLCFAIPSIKAIAGQSGSKACEKNIATIERLERQYYEQTQTHTDEYIELNFINKESGLYKIGLLSEEDIVCSETGGEYQWQYVNGEMAVVCTGEHNNLK